MDSLMIAMVLMGIPLIIAWAIRNYYVHHRLMRVLQLKAEMNSRLLDRLGTDPGALDLLRSDAQQRMFDVSLPDSGATLSAAQSRVLTSAQVGLVLLSAGFGLLYIGQRLQNSDDHEFVLVLGTLGVSLGIGAVLSSVAAWVAVRLWRDDEVGDRSGAIR